MFREIFLFEIKNRLKRPAIYLYTAVVLFFTIASFATGSLPVGEREHINSPFLIATMCAGITMMMMLISSSVMGVALYRDIEFNTRDYYLTYPVTKAGYFWGRYAGSFACMVFICIAMFAGIYLGTKLGPAMGWKDAKEYGPNYFWWYLHPFLTIALPNIFFTSSLFFGLMAITRNVKVIYSGGILLFLGYFLSTFFLNNSGSATAINLADPFGLNGIRMEAGIASAVEKNNNLVPVHGVFLWNRLLWSAIGLIILLYTYATFSFEKFFSGKRQKTSIDEVAPGTKRNFALSVQTSFTGRYNRDTLWDLSILEIRNIVRDNYFWIIVSSGMIFLGFVFWMGPQEYNVPDFPRTVVFYEILQEIFQFFIFFVIIFYTGETLHRDRATRYSFINDSLPPPNWVMNGSKLIALLLLGIFLAVMPALLAMGIQTAKGFYQYNFRAYVEGLFIIILPRLIEMVLLSHVLHVIINNKFAAYGVGITLWIGLFFLQMSGVFDHHLFLYSYTPTIRMSDMDGLGHMMGPVNWFNLYWLSAGSVLIIIAALFYNRGMSSSFKERWQLLRERLDFKTRLFAICLLAVFLAVGSYIYYNVNYLNNYLLKSERESRAILYEKTLKPYSKLPLPKIAAIQVVIDLFPDKQEAHLRGTMTFVNKTRRPVEKLLTDAQGLSSYSIAINGSPVLYTIPLLYPRGSFNWFRAPVDTADFRLYTLGHPLQPGDSVTLEIQSSFLHLGFANDLYSADLLRNGTFLHIGLPAFGYDEGQEINSPYVRKKSGLLPKEGREIVQDDPDGTRTLKAGKAADLLRTDITVSTAGNQTAIVPGDLKRKWTKDGRNYFRYIQNEPGLYVPLTIVAGRYAVTRDSVLVDHNVNISIYHHPGHDANVPRFIKGYKDGLRDFSAMYGAYPFNDIRMVETPVYGPWYASMTTLDTYAEYRSWNADFTKADQFDYCYFNATRDIAQQWWAFQVAPGNTEGSLVIPEGLATYSALVMAEKKYGIANMKFILQEQLWFYLYSRSRNQNEHPLISANEWFQWGGKAAVVLFGLKDLVGEDNINAALREFKEAYAFKEEGPFASSQDLYRYLQKHTPDSLQYYLTDTWQKVTFYDNKITDAKVTPTGNKNEYKVDFTVDIAKMWIDKKGNDIAAGQMNDYMDIGIFADETKAEEGVSQVSTLYLRKYKLTAGKHTYSIIVTGKPVRLGIDPFAKLIDRQPNDNMKEL